MQQTKRKNQFLKILHCILLIVSILFIKSCTKIDTDFENSNNNQIDAFLSVKKNASPELVQVTSDLRLQLNKTNYTHQFVQWHGTPQWDKAIKLKKTNEGCITIAIPTFKNGILTTFFAATITPANKILFEMHRASTVKNRLKEFSYIGIDNSISQFYLSVFGRRNKDILSKGLTNNSMPDPCEYCWYEWGMCQMANAGDFKIQNITIPYCWNQICATDDCGGTGGGGGGGGGGCTTCPPPPDCPDPFWYSFVPVPDPCNPPPPPPPVPQNPCIIANLTARKMDSLFTKCKVDSVLNTIPNISTEPLEKGFAMIKKKQTDPYDPNIFTFSNHYCNNVQTGTDSSITIEVNLGYREHVAGFFHTHPNSGYTAQSAKDIYSLIEGSAANPYLEGNMLKAYDGSQYAVTISNPTLASGFLQSKAQYLNGAKWNEDSEIGKAFEDARRYFKNKFKNIVNKENIAYEMAMSAVLKQFNTGITLHKKNAFGKFEPLIVTTTNPDPYKPKKKVYVQDCILILES